MKPKLTASHFAAFFEALHGYAPFQWQERLAEKACDGEWPDFVKLPTSSGKTACIDIAVFALACQAAEHHDAPERIETPRRIFFVVDRRIIVNEAFERARTICDKLEAAADDPSNNLYPVAYWLKSLTHHDHAPPLDCFELRGGIYRDDAWVRSVLQPTILTSTVDQFGSRALFRGYGVSDRNLPIHAALTANDALVLLDEAHCSQPFSQTVAAISRYRDAGLSANAEAKWSESPIRTPFVFAQMTATPDTDAAADSIFELTAADYKSDPKLEERHACAKPVRLLESKAKGKKQNQLLAKSLATEAETLADPDSHEAPCRRIAVVVNRVAAARHAYEILKGKYGDRVHLMIGRMRPIDRDKLTKTLQDTFRSNPNRNQKEQSDDPQFVVATQCLEVGADLDFDGMVSQCASLDALRQRFGRLNRLGLNEHSRGVIVMAAGDVKPKDDDPIYGTALPATWSWLQERLTESTHVDFGIQAMGVALSATDTTMLSPESVNAPVLLPAHLDLLCQTAPRPAVEPDIANFLHGPDRGQREVRVCWRADLPDRVRDLRDFNEWAVAARETVAVCPPTSAEVLTVPLHQFRHWLIGTDNEDDSGDVLGEKRLENSASSGSAADASITRFGLIWKGKSDQATAVSNTNSNSIRPNDMIVLPVSAGGWKSFGHIPGAPSEPEPQEQPNQPRLQELAQIDVASRAFKQARNRTLLRLHPAVAKNAADARWIRAIRNDIDIPHATIAEVLRELNDDSGDFESAEEGSESSDDVVESEIQTQREQLLTKAIHLIQLHRYPGGIVLIGPRDESENSHRRKLPRASFADDFDEANVDADKRILLADHLADVAEETKRILEAVPPDADVAQAVIEAARLHDIGKADPRFQAVLLQTTPGVASLLAKSNNGPSSRQATGQKLSDSLPHGFRHEMLSVELAKRVATGLNEDQQDLMLHAIASHHGYARPFAPVVFDEDPPETSLAKLDGVSDVAISADDRRQSIAAHRLDSGIAERFWCLNRRFGWWGLAWLETAVRLADWTASADPVTKDAKQMLTSRPKNAKEVTPHELPCPGLDGSNPLGFLAALGLLRTVDSLHPGSTMSWRKNGGWMPVIHTADSIEQTQLIDALHTHLAGRSTEPHFTALGQNTTVPQLDFRTELVATCLRADRRERTTADFYAAFGTDGLVSENDGITIQDTALRTMAGAGHQHFLETMRNVIEACSAHQLRKTLFEKWRYDDPTQTLSLRFDPLDDNRYALRWRNPSGDPDRKKSGSMLGANRLAIEGIPFFTTAPGPRFVQTVGFRGHRSRNTFIQWPVWTTPIPISIVASLLASPSVRENHIESLRAFGVPMVFTSQRITVGKVRNFTPAQVADANVNA